MFAQLFVVFAFANSGSLAQQVNHNTEYAGRIQCNNPNVFRTKSFYTCVSKVLGNSGIISSDDQFAACSDLQVNQARYYECICTKSIQIMECYNKDCPGDSGSISESQNQARYCAAYSTAIYIPKTESYTMPPLPSLTTEAVAAVSPAGTLTVGTAATGPATNLPKLAFPSGHDSDRWTTMYFAILLAFGIFL